MAIQGVPWDISNEIIIEHLKKSAGRTTHAKLTLNVTYMTLMKRINSDPELKEKLKEIRHEHDENLVDTAEIVLKKLADKADTDPAHALKSAFYILNNKGKERGYSPYNNPSNVPPNEANLELIQSLMEANKKQSKEIDELKSKTNAVDSGSK